jgi:N-methylhydantoinase A
MTLSIGFDIGGTFTDFAMREEQAGRWRFTKVRTTPDDRAAACLDGVQALLVEAGQAGSAVATLAHGSTVVTNTIIERKGAKTALITTRGFRDVLEIRRQIMPNRYDVRALKPEPLVPRPLRLEVGERVLPDGEVEQAVDDAELRSLLAELERQGVQAIAISLLHSYANPTNEERALAIAAVHGDWYACASHAVVNEVREYERTSTTVANAYVAPPMRRYLDRLERDLRERAGLRAPLLIFQSNGGVAPASQARALPIASVLSGPAAGVTAACAVARQVGLQDFISLDMGGTSCDVALVKDGRPAFAYEQEIGGWPVRTPRLDIHSVGAGGGSIAWVDPGGLLRVGPHSAGAAPGPACYAKGGRDATVTDANVVLGRLNPDFLLGGRMALERRLAEEAVARLGGAVGLGPVQAAAGVLDVVNSTMVRAIRVVSVERGYDPREFALLPFGGAGPLHACDLAREMGMRRIVVPPYPGLLCALGLLVSDLRVDGSLTRRLRLAAVDAAELRDLFLRVEKALRDSAAVRGRPEAGWQARYALDMRYLGQSFELTVPVAPEHHLEDGGSARLAAAFDQAHERVYGFATPAAGKEIVCVRASLQAAAGLGPGQLPRHPHGAGRAPAHRPAFFREVGWAERCPVYQRESLSPGARVEGPAVIEQMDTTTLVAPDFVADVDAQTNLIVGPR